MYRWGMNPKAKGRRLIKESAQIAITESRKPKAESRKPKAESRKPCLLHRIDTHAQPGLIPRGSVLMQRPFLNGLVERGDSLPVRLLGGGLVAFFDGLAQGAQLSAQGRGVGAIAHGAAFGLARTFQRRKMICHSWFRYLRVCRGYSGGSEFLIIGKHSHPVKQMELRLRECGRHPERSRF